MNNKEQQLLTTLNQQNQGTLDLDTQNSPAKKDYALKVFYNPKPSIRVCLKFLSTDLTNKSIYQIIVVSLQRLRNDYMLGINGNPSHYSMFRATKTGAKKQGCLEIENSIKVEELQYKTLYLRDSNKASFSGISTQYDLNKKFKKPKEFISLEFCCMGWKPRNSGIKAEEKVS